MNKRILEFAQEAIIENPTSEKWIFNDAELSRFAELIRQDVKIEMMPRFEELRNIVVQECADIAYNFADTQCDKVAEAILNKFNINRQDKNDK